jgi:nucleoside diphosphate kinase
MKEIVAIALKPDAVKCSLEGQLLADLECGLGAPVIWRKYYLFSPDDITAIYPSWVQRPEFPYMVWNFCQGPSLVLLIVADDAFKKTIALKGKMNGEGLRRKYRLKTAEEWLATSKSLDEAHRGIAENRIHSVDSFQEGADFCNLCTNSSDLADIARVHTGLHYALLKKRNVALSRYPIG